MSNNSNNIINNNYLITKILSEEEDLIKIDFSSSEISNFFILIQEGRFFKKDQKIIKYFLFKNKDFPLFYKSPFYGSLIKIEKNLNFIIIKKCKHEICYYNICNHCNYILTEKEKKEKEQKKYNLISSELNFSQSKAESIEKNKVEDYLKNKKLFLLLDLDNTILHSLDNRINILTEEFNQLKQKYNKNIFIISLNNSITNKNNNIIIKFRNHIESFFNIISPKYEIFTYTHGTKEYASKIIEYINKNFKNSGLSTEKLISRKYNKDNSIEDKTIKNVFPTTENMVVILDDKINAWKENSNNLINLKPYFFFYEEFNHVIKGKFNNVDYDHILYVIICFLNYIHGEFYDFYNRKKFKKSVKIIIKEKLQSVFNNLNFIYFEEEIKEDDFDYLYKISFKNNLYFQIKRLGGILNKYNYSEDEYEKKFKNIQILLVNKYEKNNKLIQFFQNHNKKILHSSYIEICYMFFYKIDMEFFELNEEKNTIFNIDILKIFNVHKEKIENFYKSKLDNKKLNII
jgi:FCP1-like phosphatase family protein